MSLFLKHNIFASIVSGLLLAAGFIIPQLWFVIFIGLVPLFFLIKKHDLGYKKLFTYSFVTGTVFMGIELFWLWQSIPLDWLGIDSFWLSATAILTAWLPLTIVSAITIGLWTIMVKWLGTQHIISALGLSSLWVLLEFIRAIIFNIVFLGQGSLGGPHFSFGFVGYVLANNQELLQWASIGGIWLLSFIVIFINIILFNILSNKPHLDRQYITYITILFLIYIGGFSMITASSNINRKFNIAAIYTNIEPSLHVPTTELNNRLSNLLSLITDSSHINADIILVPGGPNIYINLNKKNQWENFLQSTFNHKESLLIDTGISRDPYGVRKNRLYYINTKTGEYTNSEKTFILPDGEYLPYWHRSLAKWLNSNIITQNIARNREISRGELAHLANFKGTKVITLFCSEVMSPTLYRDATKRGASLLLNESSYAWFRGTSNIAYQMKLFAKVRAVENKRPYAQASNTSPAFMLDTNGNTIIKSPNNSQSGIIHSYLQTSTTITPYTKLGLHVLWPMLFFTLLAIYRHKYLCGQHKIYGS